MKLKTSLNLISIMSLFVAMNCFAQTKTKPAQSTKEYILDYEKFQRLQVSQKVKYIKDIQTFLAKSDFGKDPSLKTSLFNLFIKNSYAQDIEENTCIFAGHLMTMKMMKNRHLYCPKPPPSKDCKKDEVACNSLVFGKAVDANGNQTGKDICISGPFDNATEKCLDLSGKPEDIAAAISNNETLLSEWNTFQGRVTDYCIKPLAFNKKNCATLEIQTKALKNQMRSEAKRPGGNGGK